MEAPRRPCGAQVSEALSAPISGRRSATTPAPDFGGAPGRTTKTDLTQNFQELALLWPQRQAAASEKRQMEDTARTNAARAWSFWGTALQRTSPPALLGPRVGQAWTIPGQFGRNSSNSA